MIVDEYASFVGDNESCGNLGKRIEEYYHKIADRLCSRFRVTLADPDLAFLPIEERDGHDYYTDMLFALRYAKENRRRMMEKMMEKMTAGMTVAQKNHRVLSGLQ